MVRPAIFETDEESHYFLTVLPIHPKARGTSARQNTPVEDQTHPYTGVFGAETHPSTRVFPVKTLPIELQVLINQSNKRSNIKELHLLIQKLCTWQPLTAQQLVKRAGPAILRFFLNEKPREKLHESEQTNLHSCAMRN